MDRDALTVVELEQLVVEKVVEFVEDEKSFTAYDVTCAVREDEPGKDVPHNGVRGFVHGLFEDGEMDGYMRFNDASIAGFPLRYEPEPDVGAAQAAVVDAGVLDADDDGAGGRSSVAQKLGKMLGIRVGPLGGGSR